MKKKTKTAVIIGVCTVILCILLVPVRLQYKDGGTMVYRSLVGLYEVTDWNQMGMMVENIETRKTGITVKVFGRTVFDNSKTQMVSEEGNSIAMDTFYAISTENFPVELSADEMLEKAKEEGFVVFEDSNITSGEEIWQEFYDRTQAGEPAVVYLANYYTLNGENIAEEYYEEIKDEYPKFFLSSLCFDGEQYVITDRPGYETEPEMVRTYPYLVKFEGKPSSMSATFVRYVYYVLVHDKNVTWKELEWGMFSSQFGDYIDHCRVYTSHITEVQ